MSRIYISPPEVGEQERELLLEAFDSNWLAPMGSHVQAFEREMADRVGVEHAVALSSGTAALHLAYSLAGVEEGDEVLIPTFTFVATANAATYLGATPVLVDSDPVGWCIDAGLVAEYLGDRARWGRLPAAVVTVDLYGACPDYDALEAICAEYEVPLVEDSAGALGSSYRGRPAGSFGSCSIFSFSGNKIVTTGGGGMLTTDQAQLASRARHLAFQAREPGVHYEHREVGFNYGLSNLLAAVGCGQLRSLDERIARRRAVFERYRAAFEGVEGIEMMPLGPGVETNHWFTCVVFDPDRYGATQENVRLALDRIDVEARPSWKPLHLQPLYKTNPALGGAVAESIFRTGLCLPSGAGLSEPDQARIIGAILDAGDQRP